MNPKKSVVNPKAGPIYPEKPSVDQKTGSADLDVGSAKLGAESGRKVGSEVQKTDHVRSEPEPANQKAGPIFPERASMHQKTDSADVYVGSGKPAAESDWEVDPGNQKTDPLSSEAAAANHEAGPICLGKASMNQKTDLEDLGVGSAKPTAESVIRQVDSENSKPGPASPKAVSVSPKGESESLQAESASLQAGAANPYRGSIPPDPTMAPPRKDY